MCDVNKSVTLPGGLAVEVWPHGVSTKCRKARTRAAAKASAGKTGIIIQVYVYDVLLLKSQRMDSAPGFICGATCLRSILSFISIGLPLCEHSGCAAFIVVPVSSPFATHPRQQAHLAVLIVLCSSTHTCLQHACSCLPAAGLPLPGRGGHASQASF